MFKKATKTQSKLRLALIGPSGSGKTYSALAIATHLVPGGRVAVIDTERGSASKYAGQDGFNFDTLEPASFHPQQYMDAIREADAAGYDVLIIDSLSHAWMGKDGALELVDRAARRSQSNNSFAAWREVTPLHNQLVDAMLQARCHIIVTMRAKTEYVMEKDEKTGKTTPRKVGLAPVQRDGLEYEMDVVADMDLDNNLIVSKSRCRALTGALIPKPGKEVADVLIAWLTDGAPAPVLPDAPPPPPRPAAAPVPGPLQPAFPTGATGPQQPRSVGAPAGQDQAAETGTITDPQCKRLFALLREGGRSRWQLKIYCGALYGYNTSTAIEKRNYNAICEWAAKQGGEEFVGEQVAKWLDAQILAAGFENDEYMALEESASIAPFARTCDWTWAQAAVMYEAALNKSHPQNSAASA